MNQPNTLPAVATKASSGELLMNADSMERLERLADLMASGKTTVPAHLRGSKGDCFAICLQSMQWGMNPFAVAQKTHLVNGVLGYEAQLVAAVINSSGVVRDRFHFEWYGPWERVVGKFTVKRGDKGEYRVPGWSMVDEEGCGIRVWATLRGESEPRVLELLLSQARVRNSTLWADDPKQQLAYLAEKRWSRLYAPDVILGVYTADEIGDAPPERHMGMADVVQPPAPTEYPQADFDKNLSSWAKVVASGRKTLQDLIAMVGSKAPLTEAQKQALQAAVDKLQDSTVDNAAPAPSPAPEQPAAESPPAAAPPAAGPVVTFAQVNDQLLKAPDLDALFEAADLIGEVADPQHRTELAAIFDERQKALEQS